MRLKIVASDLAAAAGMHKYRTVDSVLEKLKLIPRTKTAVESLPKAAFGNTVFGRPGRQNFVKNMFGSRRVHVQKGHRNSRKKACGHHHVRGNQSQNQRNRCVQHRSNPLGTRGQKRGRLLYCVSVRFAERNPIHSKHGQRDENGTVAHGPAGVGLAGRD